jgi:hypothetical protein
VTVSIFDLRSFGVSFRESGPSDSPIARSIAMTESALDKFLKEVASRLPRKSPLATAVVDELRDHVASRIADLTQRGLSADDAMQVAIGEFGPPNLLADQFVRAGSRLRITRLVKGVAIAACAAGLVSFASYSLWPQQAPRTATERDAALAVQSIDSREDFVPSDARAARRHSMMPGPVVPNPSLPGGRFVVVQDFAPAARGGGVADPTGGEGDPFNPQPDHAAIPGATDRFIDAQPPSVADDGEEWPARPRREEFDEFGEFEHLDEDEEEPLDTPRAVGAGADDEFAEPLDTPRAVGAGAHGFVDDGDVDGIGMIQRRGMQPGMMGMGGMQGFGGGFGPGFGGGPGGGPGGPATGAASWQSPEDMAVEERLDRRIQVAFVNTPFKDAVNVIAEQCEVDILLEQHVWDGQGLQLDGQVTLRIEHVLPRARTVLRLIVQQASGGVGDYVIRDGLVFLVPELSEDEVRVYNCRDLLQLQRRGVNASAMYRNESLDDDLEVRPALFQSGGGRRVPGGGSEPGRGVGAGHPDAMMGGLGGLGGPGGLMGGMMGGMPPPGLGGRIPGKGGMGGSTGRGTGVGGDIWVHSAMSQEAATLCQVIAIACRVEESDISEFDGLLIIRASPTQHRLVEGVLKMIRAASRQRPGAEPGMIEGGPGMPNGPDPRMPGPGGLMQGVGPGAGFLAPNPGAGPAARGPRESPRRRATGSPIPGSGPSRRGEGSSGFAPGGGPAGVPRE